MIHISSIRVVQAWCVFGCCLISTLAHAQAPGPGTRFVHQGLPSSGRADGLTWSSAYRTIEEGIDDVSATELWVASGVYRPKFEAFGPPPPGNEDPRLQTFMLRNGLTLYGGFTGFEMDLGLRDWITNKTILSGDVNENFVRDPGDAYTVVYAKNVDDTAVLDGFIIEGGLADGSLQFSTEKQMFMARGGGMFIFDAIPLITNCTFTDNAAQGGGGFFLRDSAPSSAGRPLFTACRFLDNEAMADFGGGGFVNGGKPGFVDCVFNNNRADSSGGGVCLTSVGTNPIIRIDADFVGVRFTGNEATNQLGGGLFYEVDNGFTPAQNLTISGCQFIDNRAGSLAGGDAIGGGGAFIGSQVATPPGPITTIGLADVTFVNNTARTDAAGTVDGGGGMYFRGPLDVLMQKSRFFNNRALVGAGNRSSGGAIIYRARDNVGGILCLRNCVFGCNTAFGDHLDAGGGAIFFDSSNGNELIAINCTFAGNHSQRLGGGIRVQPKSKFTRISNSILWNNSAATGTLCEAQLFTGTWNINGPGLVETDFQGYNTCPGQPTNNVRENVQWVIPPDFRDSVMGFLMCLPPAPNIPVVDLRLGPLSGAIDTGEDRIEDRWGDEGFFCGLDPICQLDDADCLDRCIGDTVDRGAYEFPGFFIDCNINGHPDHEDIATGFSTDCNNDGVPDDCPLIDCNNNMVSDFCDILGASTDCDGNGILDECESIFNDCNGNMIMDACDIAHGTSLDLDGDGMPDECLCIADIAPVSLTNPCDFGDGFIDRLDFLQAKANLGACPNPDTFLCPTRCEGDADANGVVDVFDLIATLNASPCPPPIIVNRFCDTSRCNVPITDTMGTVFDTAGVPQPPLGALSQWDVQTAADDFITEQAGTIQNICFWGFDTIGSGGACTLGSHTEFQISFYEPLLHPVTDLPVPGRLLDTPSTYTVSVATNTLEIKRTGYALIDQFGQSQELLIYNASLDPGFVVIPWSECYWLEIQSLNADPGACKWTWAWSDAGIYAAINDFSRGIKYYDSAQLQVDRNLAFCLDLAYHSPIIQVPATEFDPCFGNIECMGPSADCNENSLWDWCDIHFGGWADCNLNGIPDDCEIMTITDCNTNGIDDFCDILAGTSADCDMNEVPDECETPSCP